MIEIDLWKVKLAVNVAASVAFMIGGLGVLTGCPFSDLSEATRYMKSFLTQQKATTEKSNFSKFQDDIADCRVGGGGEVVRSGLGRPVPVPPGRHDQVAAAA